MADNVQISPSGDIAAADDIGGVKYQRVKVTIGGDGVNGGDVSTSNPIPSSDVTTQQQLDQMIHLLAMLVELAPIKHREGSNRVVSSDGSVFFTQTGFATNPINSNSNPITGQVWYRTMENWQFSNTASALNIYNNIVVS